MIRKLFMVVMALSVISILSAAFSDGAEEICIPAAISRMPDDLAIAG